MSGGSRDNELRSREKFKSYRLLSVTHSAPPFTFASTIPPATQANCKLEVSLDCTPKEFEKTIRQKTGIEESSRSEDLWISHWKYFTLTLSSRGILERCHL